MRLSLLLILLTCGIVSGQAYMLSSGADYSYTVGASDVPDTWRTVEFDDSGWSKGRKVIGFGDGDDSTEVSPCISLFLRYSFLVNSLDSVQEAVLTADYDDGFVAYINGREVVRKCMGGEGTPVAHDQLADCSREAISAKHHSNQYSYYIDTSLLRQSLVIGTNVLAVQVHNDSIDGSDLSFSCNLVNRSRRSFNPYDQAWRAIQRIDLDSTNLPIVIINTLTERGNYGVRQPIGLKIIHKENHYNKLSDDANVYDELATYEIRGQSSSDWVKKSYNIELKDLLGVTQDRSLLGMSSHNDWVLAAHYTDRSLIRNMLTYTLARQSNVTAPDSRFVELVFNGDYMGVYQLLEKPKRDKNRINVEKQEPYQTENITGGYIFKFDKPSSTYMSFKKVNSVNLYSVYPDYRTMSSEQKVFVNQFWDSVLASRKDENLLDPINGYRNFIDVNSYLDFTIFNEIARNADGFFFSTFMFKPAHEKLHFGPLWDFDLTYGNTTLQNGNRTEGWLHSQQTNSNSFQKAFFKDTALVSEYKIRYKELRKGLLSTDNINYTIDSLTEYLSDATVRNYRAWPYNGHVMQSWVNNPQESYSAETDVDFIKRWTEKRLNWMDIYIEKLYYLLIVNPVSVSGQSAESACTAWQIDNGNKIAVLSSGAEIAETQIFNMQGKLIRSDQVNAHEAEIDIQNLSNGLYIIMLKLNDGSCNTLDFVK